jgi:hypothetical protein
MQALDQRAYETIVKHHHERWQHAIDGAIWSMRWQRQRSVGHQHVLNASMLRTRTIGEAVILLTISSRSSRLDGARLLELDKPSGRAMPVTAAREAHHAGVVECAVFATRDSLKSQMRCYGTFDREVSHIVTRELLL